MEIKNKLWNRSASITGFTLVELLMVVAIIAILASLLFGSLARAKASALTAACQSNLRQIGIALANYTHDDGFYPPSEHRDTSVNPFITYSWIAHLFPFMASNVPAFRCPARGKEFEWTTLSRNGYDFPLNIDPNTRFSYGYNARGAGNVGGYALSIAQGARVSVSQIRNPADMIAIGDSDGNGARDAEIAYFRLMATQLPLLTPGNHHKGGGNIVFCDGHVEWQTQAKWVALTEYAARRWNNDNQPHREIWIGGGK